MMFYWVLAYWYASEAFIEQQRTVMADRNVWSCTEDLVKLMHAVAEADQTREWVHRPTHAALSRFFDGEEDELGIDDSARPGWFHRAIRWSWKQRATKER
jgi:hypothetical protein